MKPDDKDKLNKCLDILDSTDLGLSMVWLWTWSTVKNILSDETFRQLKREDEIWDLLCEAVRAGNGFTLEYGVEQHYEHVRDWMIENEIVADEMFEDDEQE